MRQRIFVERDGERELVAQSNKVVTSGLGILAELVADVPYAPTHISLGTGAVAVADGDIALGNEIYRAEITRRIIGTDYAELELYVPKLEANGYTYTEAGILRVGRRTSVPADPARLFSRVLLSPTVVKTVTVELSIIWQLTFADATP